MELKINDINEFAKNRKINKIIYMSYTYEQKRRLKFYVYYQMKEKEEKKNLIWEYLNEPLDSQDYIITSIMLSKYGRGK